MNKNKLKLLNDKTTKELKNFIIEKLDEMDYEENFLIHNKKIIKYPQKFTTYNKNELIEIIFENCLI